ncbi:MAG TPA: 23S rRNA (guanosine(2251)-2'-O)-methyltransferase RlmB [Candidatus Kapabacteria bacterium]|nr:23S rRNA (guanosine(2251)-2'-O)-methyltransferase RlmB [Candidatus Kapabacteria bacterium]
MKEDKFYIYGRNAVIEAMNANIPLEKVYVLYNLAGDIIQKISYMANKKKIPIVKYDKQKFAELEKKISLEGFKSQGIIALRSVINYFDIDELISYSFKNNKNPTLVILNEINDVHNLGAIARSAECSGASGIIIPERNASPITPAAIKSSAGALSHIKVAKTGSIINTIVKLKDAGFWIAAADMNGKINYFDEKFDKPIVLIIGNEGKGVSSAVLKHCDLVLKIPMKGKIDSLNASVSAGIILFEILKQKLNLD